MTKSQQTENHELIPESSQTKALPLYMDGDIHLTLHTRLAQSLLNGNWKAYQQGLWQFATKVRDLWKGHQADDPYADWCFMKIDEKINHIQEAMQKIEQHLTYRLSQLRGFNIPLFENPKPMPLTLRFVTPFSYMAAAVLSELDYISRQAYTLRHIGQIVEFNQLPISVVPSIRQLFSIPLAWKVHVSRQDIRDNNALAKEAKDKMGEIPAVILNKELKFLFLLNTLSGR
ncbi:MAG TPA: TIGR03761 family integrating conjugative element protein [Gammaproteobacteria bacterium]|nr:TIGR03761 family integrating conjugative element protein [Gammaproteobacteria bacterium]